MKVVMIVFYLFFSSLSTSNRQRPYIIAGHTNPVLCVAFSPERDLFVAAHSGGIISVQSISDITKDRILSDIKGGVTSITFSPNGKLFASAADNIILWDSSTWKQRTSFPGHRRHTFVVAFSPDGTTLAAVDGEHLWFMDVGRE